jgi:CO/xanthine dehydrogenase FAD-binding subunit
MIEHVDRPHALDDALSAAAQPDSAVVAGGTDFVVQVRRRVRTWPRRLVTLERVEELRGIERHEAGMRISARTTHAELIASPDVTELATSIADGSALVGSPATRAVGTIGGNICNASPAMDLGSPLLVLEAHAELASASGGRQRVPVADLFRGSGVVGLEPGELLVAVELPPSPAQGASAYVRLGYRNAMEIAVVGAAAWLARDEDGRCSEARVALTAVAPKCVRAC